MRSKPDKDDEPTCVYCDNKTVVANGMKIELTLDQKYSSIAYHFTRYYVATGIILLVWNDGTKIIADALTKRLRESVRDILFGSWTY